MSSLVLVVGWETRTPMTEMLCQSQSPRGAKEVGVEVEVVDVDVGEGVVRVEVEESQSGGDEESRTLIRDYVLSASSVSLDTCACTLLSCFHLHLVER